MDFLRLIAVSIVLFLCIAVAVNAQNEGGGILDRILAFIKGLFGRVFGTEGQDGSASTTTLYCMPPYIQVGAICCIDNSGNGICDADERDTTTTNPTTSTTTTSTTVETTTTTTASTTTTLKIACFSNKDCGEQKDERICYKGDVYIQTVTPLCANSGRPTAECKESRKLAGQSFAVQASPAEECSKGCDKGQCL